MAINNLGVLAEGFVHELCAMGAGWGVRESILLGSTFRIQRLLGPASLGHTPVTVVRGEIKVHIPSQSAIFGPAK